MGLDLHPLSLQAARMEAGADPGLRLVQADALRLPFADRSFHVVFANLTLHHFSDAAACQVIREMRRVSSVGVVVQELERTPVHLAAARLLAHTLWARNSLTRHDAPLSVSQAFTRPELAELGREAGFQRVRVRRIFPWRLLLEAWRGGPGVGDRP